MEKVTVLISCMHQSDHSIVTRTNVQTDCVVINQCDTDKTEVYSFVNKSGRECTVKFISTTDRGLSRSRNMAIANADDDSICVICDDDESLADDYESKILSAYGRYPHAGAISFSMNRTDKKYGKVYPAADCKLGFKRIIKTTSIELTFRKSALLQTGVHFDEKMGSGTGNGGGEENKFMFDLRKNKVQMYYCTENIGTVYPAPSQWFTGYNSDIISSYGWAARRSMGSCIAFAYCNYWVLTHHKLYKENLSWWGAYKSIFRGYFEKR